MWDVTVTDTLANSYVDISSVSAGGAAELAADRKTSKYNNLSAGYSFVPLAFETLGPVNQECDEFLNTLGKRLMATTGDKRESSFLRQRLHLYTEIQLCLCKGYLQRQPRSASQLILNPWALYTHLGVYIYIKFLSFFSPGLVIAQGIITK